MRYEFLSDFITEVFGWVRVVDRKWHHSQGTRERTSVWSGEEQILQVNSMSNFFGDVTSVVISSKYLKERIVYKNTGSVVVNEAKIMKAIEDVRTLADLMERM